MAEPLSRVNRQLVVGIAVVVSAATVSSATFNFVVNPMTEDLGASEQQTSLLRQLPSLGSLLVIFVIGTWGVRLGSRRIITLSAIAMAIGYLLMTLAPVMGAASAGMLLGSLGKQGLTVIAVSLIASKLTSEDDRATGFATLGAVTPMVYLVAPLVATVVLELSSWRAITALWGVAALFAVVASRRLLPPDSESRAESGEMWTPALAGLVLASSVQWLNQGSYAGWMSAVALTWMGISLIALLTLFLLMRRIDSPSLDLSLFRKGGFPLLIIVVALIPFTNLWFYFASGTQIVYGYSAVVAALLMVPAQLFGVIGAALTRKWIQDRGLRFAGSVMLTFAGGALLLCTFQSVDTPVIFPVLVLCLYTAAFTGAMITLTNQIMNLADRGAEGSASALRGAAGSLGTAVGVVVLTSVTFGVATTTFSAALEEQGQDPAQATAIVDELQDGLSSEEISARNSIPLDTIELIDDDLKQAMIQAYRAQGLVGGCVSLLSALVFFFNRSGHHQTSRREDEKTADR